MPIFFDQSKFFFVFFSLKRNIVLYEIVEIHGIILFVVIHLLLYGLQFDLLLLV